MTGIFCAIDKPDVQAAIALVKELAPLDVDIKLGLEFFTAAGLSGVDKIRALTPRRIFLDLKLHDIPNTVAGAVKAAAKCAPDFLTIHASGGAEMMKAAADAAGGIRLLGVTVLTSLDDDALETVGQQVPAAEQALRLARLAKASGLYGVVCSPHEIARLKKDVGIPVVVPGIRPPDADAGDQKRVMTPVEAAALGADYLVIGRPITAAKDPAMAASQILATLGKKAA